MIIMKAGISYPDDRLTSTIPERENKAMIEQSDFSKNCVGASSPAGLKQPCWRSADSRVVVCAPENHSYEHHQDNTQPTPPELGGVGCGVATASVYG